MNLTNHVALITGAARRVGRAIALELARAGCDVAVHCRNSREDAERTAGDIRQLGRRAVTLQADLADAAQVSALPQQAADALGGLHILVNNASIYERTPLDTLDLADWQRIMAINLTAPMLLSQSAAPILRKSCATASSRRSAVAGSASGGMGRQQPARADGDRDSGRLAPSACIINLTDISAERPWGGYLAYCAAKGGLATLTRALARALAPDIRVNAVAPGAILFPESYTEEKKERIIARVPAQRAGSPEDVAAAVRFLAEAEYVTGHMIPVDGGRHIAW